LPPAKRDALREAKGARYSSLRVLSPVGGCRSLKNCGAVLKEDCPAAKGVWGWQLCRDSNLATPYFPIANLTSYTNNGTTHPIQKNDGEISSKEPSCWTNGSFSSSAETTNAKVSR